MERSTLASRELLEARLRAAARERQPVGSIASICILTKERPFELDRCLTQLVRHVDAYGRHPIVRVFDDAVAPDAQAACRDLVRAHAVRTRLPLVYIGAEEKRRLACHLMKAGVPGDVVDVAIAGSPHVVRSTGANRNAAMLFTVGELSLSIDDDEECRVAASPEREDVLGYYAGYDPSSYWFFPSREATLAALRTVDVDVLGLHERLLGQSVPLASSASIIDPDSVDPRFVERLITSPSGRVLATLMGIAGDCGMATPRWLWLTGASRDRLIETEEAYRSAWVSPEVLKVVRRETISAGRFCMTGCVAYDNRELLPPFFPCGRNTDGLFGTVLRRCFQDGYFGHLPWAMWHSPPAARRFPPNVLLRHTRQHALSDLLGACLKAAPLETAAEAADARLRCLAGALMEAAVADLDDFEEYVHQRLCADARATRESLDALRRASDEAPAYWIRDIETLLRTLDEVLAAPRRIRPRELDPIGDDTAVRLVFRGLVRRFAALLDWWPEMVRICRSLDLGSRAVDPL